MTVIAFSMTGNPRGKGRPRVTTRGGFARAYTDPKTREYEASVREIAAKAMGAREPLTGPLSVSLRFRLSPPKSMSKRQRARVLGGEEAYLGVFDIDNLQKSILDGCNTVCFEDDRQIVRLWGVKFADAVAGVDVRIEALEPQGVAQ